VSALIPAPERKSLWARLKSALTRAPSASSPPVTGSIFAGVTATGRPPIRGQAEMLQAYGTMPRLRAVIDRIAYQTASTPWRAHKIDLSAGPVEKAFGRNLTPKKAARLIRAEVRAARMRAAGASRPHKAFEAVIKRLSDHGLTRPLPGHDALDLLNTPNPHMTAAQVRQQIQIQLDLVGECFLVLEFKQGTKTPAELWPVPPSWVLRMPMVGSEYYEIRGLDGYGIIRRVPPDQVIWMRNVDPANPYGRGSGVGLTLNNELDADEFAAQTASVRFWNNATPDLIIGVDGINEDEAERFKEKWYQQHQGRFRHSGIHVTNGKIDVKQLSSSFADMELIKLREFERDAIRETFGVPPEMVGDLKDSNRATSQNAQRIFALNVIMPRLDLLEDYYNNVLMPMFGESSEDTVLLYENPVPEDHDLELEVAKSVQWALSADEWRKFAGLAPLPPDPATGEGKGLVHMVPIALTPMNLGGSGPLYLGEPDAESDDEDDSGTEPEASAKPTEEPNPSDTVKPTEPAQPAAEKPDKTHAPYRVLPFHPTTKRTDRRIDRIIASLDADDLTDAITPIWHHQLLAQMSEDLGDLGASDQINLGASLIQKHIKTLGAERISGLVDETTKDALRDTLAEGLDDGDTLREMTARVQAVFGEADEVRAERIARTETGRSSNWGIHTGQKLAGIQQREWIANKDDSTRDTHEALDGTVVGIDESFSIEGASAMYPGDFGDPAEDVNCRCTTAPVLEPGKDAAPTVIGRRVDVVAYWRRFDARQRAWELQAAAALRSGFRRQQSRVVHALRREFAKREVGR
jgi:HK97 family phage portal protein